MQLIEEDVLVNVLFVSVHLGDGLDDLLLDRFNRRRKKAIDAENLSLGGVESETL